MQPSMLLLSLPEGTLLTWVAPPRTPSSFPPKPLSLLQAQSTVLRRVAPAQGPNVVLACAKILSLHASLFLQPGQVPLKSSPALQHIKHIPPSSVTTTDLL